MGQGSGWEGIPSSQYVRQLIRRLQAGGDIEEDFRQLFRRYYRVVHRFYAERGFEPDECDNLAQETFLAVFRGLQGFRHESGFDGWLFGIARKIYTQAVRRTAWSRRRWGTEVSIDDAPEDRMSHVRTTGARDALERVLSSELSEVIGAAIADLPDQMRRCAELRFRQGLTYVDIAETLKISVDAVRVQLVRARKRLRQRILEDYSSVRI